MSGSFTSTKNGNALGDDNLDYGDEHCAIAAACSPASPGRTCRASTLNLDLLLKFCYYVGTLYRMLTTKCWRWSWCPGCLRTGGPEGVRRIAAWPFPKGRHWMAVGCPRPRCFPDSMRRYREAKRR